MFVGGVLHTCPALPLLGTVCLLAQLWSEPNYAQEHNQEKGQCHSRLMGNSSPPFPKLHFYTKFHLLEFIPSLFSTTSDINTCKLSALPSFTSSAINDIKGRKLLHTTYPYSDTPVQAHVCLHRKINVSFYQSLSAITHSSGMQQLFIFPKYYIIDSPLILGHPWLT